MKVKLEIETIETRQVTLALKDSKSDSFIDVEINQNQANEQEFGPSEGSKLET
jgi:hypothetical protein